jgi:hypothetical protein
MASQLIYRSPERLNQKLLMFIAQKIAQSGSDRNGAVRMYMPVWITVVIILCICCLAAEGIIANDGFNPFVTETQREHRELASTRFRFAGDAPA